eukprot:6487752-Amphidinium_carterae.1
MSLESTQLSLSSQDALGSMESLLAGEQILQPLGQSALSFKVSQDDTHPSSVDIYARQHTRAKSVMFFRVVKVGPFKRASYAPQAGQTTLQFLPDSGIAIEQRELVYSQQPTLWLTSESQHENQRDMIVGDCLTLNQLFTLARWTVLDGMVYMLPLQLSSLAELRCLSTMLVQLYVNGASYIAENAEEAAMFRKMQENGFAITEGRLQ